MRARYTECLRDLMQNEHTKEALDKALSTYPLYTDKTHDMLPTREVLNSKLLNYYKYREIGFETVGRFLDELEITMCHIMPHYNELFKTIIIMAETPSPFDNVDIVETYEEQRSDSSTREDTNSNTSTNEQSAETTGNSDIETTSKSNTKQLESDTPQDQLAIATNDIDSVDYASKAEWGESISEGSEGKTYKENNTSEGSTSSQGTSQSITDSSGTITHTRTKKGNQGVNTYAHDIMEYRTAIIDVVDQIITDSRIADLFMMVY